MNRIVLTSRVSSDGVLKLCVPVGSADEEVRVTIESLVPRDFSAEEWKKGILAVAGTWQGEWERPVQGEYERRDSMP